MDSYYVAVEGLESLENVEELEARIALKAQQAINRVTRDARASSAKEIRQQVAFPARYLSGKNSRLKIDEYASVKNLQAKITGRGEPTSLARFSKEKDPKAARRKGGVTVTVKPGSPIFMKGAFLMRLKNSNLGLAIRPAPGASIRGKRKVAKPLGNGAFLLYGPSVNQVFAGVAEDDYATVAAKLEREFLRLLEI